MELEEAIQARRSIKSYDPDYEVSDETLRELLSQVIRSPSSFNLQHARFVVIRDAESRKKLQEFSWGQRHVGEAPASVLVCGKVRAHEDADRANGHAPPEVREKLVPMIEGIYATKPQLQRDEAIRSGALASMTLMLVARSMGLATCPMIGFDQERVAALAGLPEGFIPVMLITLGKAGPGEPFPTSRFDLDELVRLETLDGERLTSA